jgi:hypothetical protein
MCKNELDKFDCYMHCDISEVTLQFRSMCGGYFCSETETRFDKKAVNQ